MKKVHKTYSQQMAQGSVRFRLFFSCRLIDLRPTTFAISTSYWKYCEIVSIIIKRNMINIKARNRSNFVFFQFAALSKDGVDCRANVQTFACDEKGDWQLINFHSLFSSITSQYIIIPHRHGFKDIFDISIFFLSTADVNGKSVLEFTTREI